MINIADPEGVFDRISGQWKAARAWLCPLSDGRRALLIHPGALSDGISSPRIIWPLIGPYEPSTFAPGLLHDSLYRAELVDRKTADDEFRRMLLLYGMGKTKALLCWVAVRIGGRFVWANHTPESVAEARRYAELITE